MHIGSIVNFKGKELYINSYEADYIRAELVFSYKHAEKGGSFISLEGEFYNDVGIIMENGSDRASNEKFTDDKPTNGAAEAKAAMEAQMNIAALIDANEGALGIIADLSGKPLVQLEDVNSLPEYKVGMNALDGTIMMAAGLDGKLR